MDFFGVFKYWIMQERIEIRLVCVGVIFDWARYWLVLLMGLPGGRM